MESNTEIPGIVGKGWLRQPPDENDWIYTPPPSLHIKPSVDLRDTHQVYGVPFDQGHLGSCTANAIAAALSIAKKAEGWGPRHAPYNPSRLYIWYHGHILGATDGVAPSGDDLAKVLYTQTAPSLTVEKDGHKKTVTRAALLNAVKSDEGCYIRDGFKGVVKYGFCSEDDWKYAEKNWHVIPSGAVDAAKSFTATEMIYRRIHDVKEGSNNVVQHIEAALSESYPVVFGFEGSDRSAPLGYNRRTKITSGLDEHSVYKGWVKDGEKTWGHAVVIIGYDHGKGLFLCLNSWGDGFGDKGYFYMPYRWFEPSEGWFVNDKGHRLTRTSDIWVLQSPRLVPGTLGSGVPAEKPVGK